MISLGAMVRQLAGMEDTKDLSEWENEFLKTVLARSEGGTHTSRLSERQAEIVEELWKRHFA